MTFAERLEALKKSIDEMITSETPVEQVSKFADIKKEADALAEIHQKQSDDYAQLKDRYIDAVKNYGTGAKPKDDSEQGKEITLESIGAEIISKRGK